MPVFGYLDPGTGSLFLQAVVGFILGGIFMFRGFLLKLASKFKKGSKRREDNEKTAE